MPLSLSESLFQTPSLSMSVTVSRSFTVTISVSVCVSFNVNVIATATTTVTTTVTVNVFFKLLLQPLSLLLHCDCLFDSQLPSLSVSLSLSFQPPLSLSLFLSLSVWLSLFLSLSPPFLYLCKGANYIVCATHCSIILIFALIVTVSGISNVAVTKLSSVLSLHCRCQMLLSLSQALSFHSLCYSLSCCHRN